MAPLLCMHMDANPALRPSRAAGKQRQPLFYSAFDWESRGVQNAGLSRDGSRVRSRSPSPFAYSMDAALLPWEEKAKIFFFFNFFYLRVPEKPLTSHVAMN